MTLIEDILLAVDYASEHRARSHPEMVPGTTTDVEAAARRVLAAHYNGGLPRAIAGQILAGAERRLAALIQSEIELLAGGGG
jgi:hypothetical protein